MCRFLINHFNIVGNVYEWIFKITCINLISSRIITSNYGKYYFLGSVYIFMYFFSYQPILPLTGAPTAHFHLPGCFSSIKIFEHGSKSSKTIAVFIIGIQVQQFYSTSFELLTFGSRSWVLAPR